MKRLSIAKHNWLILKQCFWWHFILRKRLPLTIIQFLGNIVLKLLRVLFFLSLIGVILLFPFPLEIVQSLQVLLCQLAFVVLIGLMSLDLSKQRILGGLGELVLLGDGVFGAEVVPALPGSSLGPDLELVELLVEALLLGELWVFDAASLAKNGLGDVLSVGDRLINFGSRGLHEASLGGSDRFRSVLLAAADVRT